MDTIPAQGDSVAHVEVAERFAVVPEALLYDPAISADAVRLYGILARHGSDPSNCYPGTARLGKLMGRHPGSITRYAAELEAAGWITRHERMGDGGRTSNGYTVYATPRAVVRATPAQDCALPPRTAARQRKASERQPAKRSARAAADAAAPSLPGVGPQPEDNPVDTTAAARGTEAAGAPEAPDAEVDPEAEAWRLVRECWDRRDRKPLERRDHAAKTVVRLLAAGHTATEVRRALMASPAWTPTALQVELRKGRSVPGGVRRVRPPADDPRREGESRVVDIAEEMRRRG